MVETGLHYVKRRSAPVGARSTSCQSLFGTFPARSALTYLAGGSVEAERLRRCCGRCRRGSFVLATRGSRSGERAHFLQCVEQWGEEGFAFLNAGSIGLLCTASDVFAQSNEGFHPRFFGILTALDMRLSGIPRFVQVRERGIAFIERARPTREPYRREFNGIERRVMFGQLKNGEGITAFTIFIGNGRIDMRQTIREGGGMDELSGFGVFAGAHEGDGIEKVFDMAIPAINVIVGDFETHQTCGALTLRGSGAFDVK